MQAFHMYDYQVDHIKAQLAECWPVASIADRSEILVRQRKNTMMQATYSRVRENCADIAEL